jgi:protein phosphatase
VADKGLVRQTNQDSIYVPDLQRAREPRGLLLAVADGMGGHNGGETASRTLTESLAAFYEKSTSELAIAEELRNLILEANRTIYRLSRGDPDLMGMGTTLTAAFVQNQKATVLQVGDSRAYHRRGKQLTQVTLDHSFVAEQIRLGNVTPEEGRTHPKRNVITRAVGTRPFLEIDTYEIELQIGDDLLLCSDGLHGFVPEDKMLLALEEDAPADRVAGHLLELAYQGGGQDNIGIVLFRLRPAPAQSWFTRLTSFLPFGRK